MKRRVLILAALLPLGVWAAIPPRTDKTTNTSGVPIKESVAMNQGSSWVLGWRFTEGATGTAKDLTGATRAEFFYTDNSTFSVTATGTVDVATNGETSVTFTPAQLNTNTANGVFDFVYSVIGTNETLAFVLGEFVLNENPFSTASGLPVNTNVLDINSYTSIIGVWPVANVPTASALGALTNLTEGTAIDITGSGPTREIAYDGTEAHDESGATDIPKGALANTGTLGFNWAADEITEDDPALEADGITLGSGAGQVELTYRAVGGDGVYRWTGAAFQYDDAINMNDFPLYGPLDPTNGLGVGDRDYEDIRYVRAVVASWQVLYSGADSRVTNQSFGAAGYGWRSTGPGVPEWHPAAWLDSTNTAAVGSIFDLQLADVLVGPAATPTNAANLQDIIDRTNGLLRTETDPTLTNDQEVIIGTGGAGAVRLTFTNNAGGGVIELAPTGGFGLYKSLNMQSNVLSSVADPVQGNQVGDRMYNDRRYINTNETNRVDLQLADVLVQSGTTPTNAANIQDVIDRTNALAVLAALLAEANTFTAVQSGPDGTTTNSYATRGFVQDSIAAASGHEFFMTVDTNAVFAGDFNLTEEAVASWSTNFALAAGTNRLLTFWTTNTTDRVPEGHADVHIHASYTGAGLPVIGLFWEWVYGVTTTNIAAISETITITGAQSPWDLHAVTFNTIVVTNNYIGATLYAVRTGGANATVTLLGGGVLNSALLTPSLDLGITESDPLSIRKDGSAAATANIPFGGFSIFDVRVPEFLDTGALRFIPGAGLTTNSGVGALPSSSTIGSTNVLFGIGAMRHAATLNDSEFNFVYHPQFDGVNTNTLYFFADATNPASCKFQLLLYDGQVALHSSGDQNALAADTLETYTAVYTTSLERIFGRLIGYSQLTNAVYFQGYEP